MSVRSWGISFTEEERAPRRKIILPTVLKGLPKDSPIVSVSLGSGYALLLTESGKVYAVGSTKDTRSGIASEKTLVTPVKIDQLANVVEVAAGYSHGLCRTSTNQVYIWGKTIDTVTKPKLVTFPTDEQIVKLHAGYLYSGALTASGKLFLWGKNYCGKMGFGDGIQQIPDPKELVGYQVHDFFLGYNHTIFCTTEGRVYTIGNNDYYQLGIGKDKKEKSTPQLVPLPYDPSDKVVQVSAAVGSAHNCHAGAVTQSGALYMWGNGYKFKLGTGTLDDQPTPVKIHFFDNVPIASLICGGIHNLCLTQDGSVYSWGCGSDGRLGHPESEGHRYLYKEEEPRKIEFENDKKAKILCSSYYSALALF